MLAGNSSGWQKANSPNVVDLNPELLAETAARKARQRFHEGRRQWTWDAAGTRARHIEYAYGARADSYTRSAYFPKDYNK